MKAVTSLALAIVVVVGIGKVMALAAAMAIVEAITAGGCPSPWPLGRHAWGVNLRPVH